MSDYSVKPKLITQYGNNVLQLVDYFSISLQSGKYVISTPEQVRLDLINKFNGYGTRLQHFRVPTV